MASEILRAEAVCLGIRPWSRTSHVTSWLTGSGKVLTVVKGAVRPKSAFLGQYDLNYTCEILYYARERNGLHALRECTPIDRRDYLRGDYRALVLAEHYRRLAAELTPSGPDAADWLSLLSRALDDLRGKTAADLLPAMLDFERKTLELSGVWPEIPGNGGELVLPGDRKIPIPGETATCLAEPAAEKNLKILLDAARVISVLYALNLELASDSRRSVLQLICKPEQGK